eukprot:CAMPEP_0119505048 /NCGR_PEP_ID=MMETSP1344-20130328/25712_1 /TAXON_ID=236787 /ORGANISM="Florenciella parvula, Strain CCMP2471" /LENGTH=74 /DNA_ID=CAMNT_0007541475 /DNA_START=138 /DNA_END=359 /DNA_ORIENTATION=-
MPQNTDGDVEYQLPSAWVDERKHTVASEAEYKAMYDESIADPGAFWTKIAREFDWKGAPLDAATALEYNFDRSK